MTASGRSGIRARRADGCALCVNLDAMRVKGLVWLGIPAGDYAAAVRFFAQTLGLEVAFDDGNTVELAAGNGDRIQLFGPGRRYFEFCRSHGASIVPLLEVDDLDQASAELVRGGAAARRAGVRRHLDLAHLPGARREHPQPGRPHGVAAR